MAVSMEHVLASTTVTAMMVGEAILAMNVWLHCRLYHNH